MKKILVFLAIVFLLMSSSCNKSNLQSHDDNSLWLHVSTGGGFSGSSTGYSLSSNGHVQRWQESANGEKSLKAENKIKAKTVTPFFEQIKVWQETNINTPGNMTSKLTYETPDTTLTWLWTADSTSETLPENFFEYYESLWRFCQNNID